MITRRAFILGASVGSVACLSQARVPVTHAETSDACIWLDTAGFADPSKERVDGATMVGRDPATIKEAVVGFRLLFGAPRGASPMHVAKYFQHLPDVNDDKEAYNAEWASKRANPVITSFFAMTRQLPNDGDQTAWCAAFVNFCLGCSGRPMTMSASSGSFRTYGKVIKDPDDAKPGDIVVFSKNGADGVKGYGHVGFYVGKENGKYVVLGGNQVGNSKTTGKVIEASFSGQGSLELFNFCSLNA